MLLQRVQALLFILIGVVSFADAWRISVQARESANFDAIGPDRYLLALGVVLFIGGAWSLLRRPSPAAPSTQVNAEPGEVSSTLVLTLGLVAGFAALMPLIGFSLACWPWWKTIVVAAIIAAAFHVTFVQFADMPLPKVSLWY